MPEGEENIAPNNQVEDPALMEDLSMDDISLDPPTGSNDLVIEDNSEETPENEEEVSEEGLNEDLERGVGEENSEESSEEDNYEEEYVEDTQYFNDISETTGLEITSEEDLHDALTYAREVMDAEDNKYNDLPQEIQMAIDVYNKGGDYQTALQQASMDYDNMDSKEVLKQQFFNKNGELVKSDKNYAEMKFEKDYDTNYGILDKYNQITDEDEKSEFYEENRKDIDFAKVSYEHDVNNARTTMGEFKTSSTTPVEQVGYSQEEHDGFMQEHSSSVERTVGEYDGIELGLSDNAEDNFNLKLGDDQMELLKETLTDPQEFLEEVLGIKLEQGSFTDYSKFASAFTLLQNTDNLISVLGPYYMEKQDKKSVEEIAANPPSKTDSRTGPESSKDDLDEVADAFRRQRKINMK